MTLLEEIQAKLGALPESTRAELAKTALEATKHLAFIPNPGPQTECYMCKADVALYGGAAGGGKSLMLLGTAANDHKRSLILRREAAELDGLIADSHEIINKRGTFNGSEKEWTFDGSKSLKFGGMKEAEAWRKFAGRPRDFMGFDEAAEFLEVQVSSIMAWLRSTDPAQRCRAVLASNPPRTSEGEWLFRWFAPWLDPTFPNLAQPGELRWCIVVGEERRWVAGPAPVMIEGEEYTPLSYTFIPSNLDDNPFLAKTSYRTRLQNMPGPLRAQLLKGDFSAGREDQDWQTIPTAWISAAQDRWRADGFRGNVMTAMALDPAGGGRDSAELAMRYGGWYAPLVSVTGPETADGSASAATVVKHRRDACAVVIDVGGGYGGSVMLRLKDNDIPHIGFNGAGKSVARTKGSNLSFVNARAEAWWRFREELDPDQEGGSAIALPPDNELRADLAAPTWELKAGGIQIESKEDIRARLGRSPGKGDAVVMALAFGNKAAAKRAHYGGRAPVVITKRPRR